MTFRRVLFWMHLVAGLISGAAIAVMCVTGTILAFEKEWVSWAERDARRVEVAASTPTRLTLDEMQARLRAEQPEARPTSIVVSNDPAAAVSFVSGRSGGFYVNPYTGEIRQPKSRITAETMRVAIEWHRYLGFGGEESRPRGKLINGICNVAFFALAVTGLYLWMPRQWSWRGIRPVIWFRQNSTSKARDFNWHNAIGFWSAPVLIILTVTAMPISFRWATNLIYTLTGTPAPAANAGGGMAGVPAIELPAAPAGARPVPLETLFLATQQAVPTWQTITVRLGGPQGRGREGQGTARAESTNAPRSGERTRGAQAMTFTVREKASWPRTATTTVAFNPYSGEIVQRTGYGEMNAAQRVRAWTRFLHTGEAVGWPGQLIAGLASLGGAFLVYTGVALSWRRFFSKKERAEPAKAEADVSGSGVTEKRLAGDLEAR